MISLLSPESVYMVCLVLSSLLLFLSVYFMITLSDLESDYINSRDCAARLNFWTAPRIIAQGTQSFLLLSTQSWLLFVSSLPASSWLIFKRVKIPSGNSGLYDPTEIHIKHNLRNAITESLGFMGFHMASFFVLMWMLVGQVDQDKGTPSPVQKEVPW